MILTNYEQKYCTNGFGTPSCTLRARKRTNIRCVLCLALLDSCLPPFRRNEGGFPLLDRHLNAPFSTIVYPRFDAMRGISPPRLSFTPVSMQWGGIPPPRPSFTPVSAQCPLLDCCLPPFWPPWSRLSLFRCKEAGFLLLTFAFLIQGGVSSIIVYPCFDARKWFPSLTPPPQTTIVYLHFVAWLCYIFSIPFEDYSLLSYTLLKLCMT